ncbi:bifunctional adenosylcobinamide kinase/adenosylcobinamide-phosphate guanylyltransferase [Xylophilus sp.]|uniref:bifunctional adenosylcobinamide kinase/adenosylcobinamide-phosphate guanylyltransferase n=1 Tax=Xylophilus sp. TaxID=2653893 RepID=UPI0013BB3F25|nr:bifunctional adenosylcobinamide kinase/adenosylcobinamide-phosphate guanylyltransferase [Xylophilus sp.]KAF1049216.1 MAG: Bifunctional adenosylcobalamin biosynthesis protein CobP [Xylophilus sp.]
MTRRSELILGGQKNGKSRRAELLARDWLASAPRRRSVLIATGEPWDDEMRARIARHRAERAARVPGLATVEEALDLPGALLRESRADTLVVVDCLTLWLTNLAMPAAPRTGGPAPGQAADALARAIGRTAGPVVLVSNEIGLGVVPMGREVRAFVDGLGRLNQAAAAACDRVVLMAAGLPLVVKDAR